jgi:hypothetical protein
VRMSVSVNEPSANCTYSAIHPRHYHSKYSNSGTSFPPSRTATSLALYPLPLPTPSTSPSARNATRKDSFRPQWTPGKEKKIFAHCSQYGLSKKPFAFFAVRQGLKGVAVLSIFEVCLQVQLQLTTTVVVPRTFFGKCTL